MESTEAIESAPVVNAAEAAPVEAVPVDAAGGSRELLKLATPLLVSQSFMTVQVFLDTVLLAQHKLDEATASFPAMMWFWLLFGFLQVTAGYTSTFVAQYTGAGRPQRVGPAVWQGVHFAIGAGLLFLLMVPAAPYLIAAGRHSRALQELEVQYLQCLAFAAMPMMIMGAVNGFFSGRGQTWTVLGIEAFGTGVNVLLALALIFGRAGFPEMGIAGAGWATVAGSWASALIAVVLLILPRGYRQEFATLSGWRLERELFSRLLRYGGPAGVQVFLDVLVFHLFAQMVGQLGDAAMGATTLTVRLNMIAFLPMMGLGQAVCILVGQRLGGDRPDLAERSTYTGLRWTFGYMVVIAFIYVAIPVPLVSLFEGSEQAKFAEVAAIVPNLLICVAIYSLADAVNVTFAFALRGAGDTRFVSLLTFCLAWPILVIPTFVVVATGASVYWAWVCATAYIVAMAVCFCFRFRSGKWKTMRVIEAAPAV